VTDRSGDATALIPFHDVPEQVFEEWFHQVRDAAEQSPGHRHTSPAEHAQRAVAFTFDTERSLHRWLDSPEWAQALKGGEHQGIRREFSDLVIVEGQVPPTGTAMFRHRVEQRNVDGFIDAQRTLMELNEAAPGYEFAVLFGPRSLADGTDEWSAVLKFRTDESLAEWIDSPDREGALAGLRSHLSQEYSSSFEHNTFGSIMRVTDGKPTITPEWKVAMMVLLVLYPTVMTLSRFVGPVLDGWGADPWLSMWLSQILSVSLLTYVLMPFATWVFGFWLDPDRGSSARASVIGALTVCVLYGLTLTVFASVRWLQFWDYV
jgi:antibiotic biosynthesis monooxygenase (ABM) superfamily enzyme